MLRQIQAYPIGRPISAPRNLSPPAIATTTPTEEAPIPFTAGEWEGDPLEYAYYWTIGSRQVDGEDATPANADIDASVTLYERARNEAGWSDWVSSETVGPVVAGFDYYVDSVNGNDANAGTTLATAKKTLAALGTLQRGYAYGLARGSSWREILGSASSPPNGVTVGACGVGKKPVIRADDIVSTWSKTSGKTNVYENTWTPIAGEINILCIYENGSIMTRVADVATCDATPGSFYVNPTYTDGVTAPIYIHATGSGDPNSNGAVYEVPRRLYAVRLGNDCIARGIRAKRSINKNGCLEAGLRFLGEDNIYEDGHGHNALMASGNMSRCYGWKSDPNLALWTPFPSGYFFVHYIIGPGLYGAGDVTYTDCVALMQQATGHSIQGFYGHSLTTAVFRDVSYVNCIAAYCSTGFMSAHHRSVSATDCLAYECGIGYFQKEGFLPMNLTRCEYFSTNSTAFSYVYAVGNQTFDVPDPFTISDSVLVTPKDGLRFGGGFKVTIERSIIAGSTDENTSAAIYRPGSDTDAIRLTINDTLFDRWGTASRRDVMNITNTSVTTISASNNVYATYGGATGYFVFNNLTYTTPAAYLAAGYESGSTYAPTLPQLTYAITRRRYDLKPGNEAATQGVGPVGFTPQAFDYTALVAMLEAA